MRLLLPHLPVSCPARPRPLCSGEMQLLPSAEPEVGVGELGSPPPAGPPPPEASFPGASSLQGGMEGEGYAPGADPDLSDFASDPAKCSGLSLEEKRKIVYKISQSPDNAYEFLQGWTRRDLLQIICAEMGEERKYTGLAKTKMIERLLKLVLQKNIGTDHDDSIPTQSNSDKINGVAKKKRKFDQHRQLATESVHLPPNDGYHDDNIPTWSTSDQTNGITKKKRKVDQQQQPDTESVDVPSNDGVKERDNILFCQNLACQATFGPEHAFCKRCSCCICYCYDENKDPSLWLVCNSDPPFQGGACGLSCHLKCALKDERAGIMRNVCHEKLDGSFYCVCCKKVNDLIGNLRKQLSIAKDARRVDVLCHRISLSHQILKGTERYKELQAIVHLAAMKLKKEVGPLDKVSAMMARGIVNRLACGAEVQKLCATAVETVNLMLSGLSVRPPDSDVKSSSPTTCRIEFEDVSPVSVVISLASEHQILEEVVIGYRLWHRKSCLADYSEEPTCVLLRPNTRIMISGLSPSTEYYFKASPFSSTGELGVGEAILVTTAANGNACNFSSRNSGPRIQHGGTDEEKVKGELHATTQTISQKGSTSSSDSPLEAKRPRINSKSHFKVRPLEDIGDYSVKRPLVPNDIPFSGSNPAPLETPTKSDAPSHPPDSGDKSESAERQYEYCVKVIRWLECEGHLEKEFRVKFLTWFSLKATVQERRVVSAFIDILIDEPASLVDQLVDAFLDGICSNEKLGDGRDGKVVLKNRLCTRLWH